MPKFAANLTKMFRELPFLDRFDAAADAGFQGVEVFFPYDDAATELTRRMGRNALVMVLINCPPPNWAGGSRGLAAVPGTEARFQYDFRRSLRYAQALGAKHLNLMTGKAEGAAARETLVENLKWAVAQAPEMSLTLEPINPDDMPGYFLNDFGQTLDILDEVGARNLRLQLDMYHAQKITGDAFATWETHRDRIAHIQIAGYPDRAEPLRGDIDYPAFFAALDESGYRGWVSAEYTPKGRTEDGLSWLASS